MPKVWAMLVCLLMTTLVAGAPMGAPATRPAERGASSMAAATMPAGVAASEPAEDVPPPMLLAFILIVVLVILAIAMVCALMAMLALGLLLLLVLLGILSTSAMAGLANRSFGTALGTFIIQAAAVAGAIVGVAMGLLAAAIFTPRVPWLVFPFAGGLGGIIGGGAMAYLFVRVFSLVMRTVRDKLAERRRRKESPGLPLAERFEVEAGSGDGELK